MKSSGIRTKDLVPGQTYHPRRGYRLVKPGQLKYQTRRGRSYVRHDIWRLEDGWSAIADHTYERLLYIGFSRELGRPTHVFLIHGKVAHFSPQSIQCMSDHPQWYSETDTRRKHYAYE